MVSRIKVLIKEALLKRMNIPYSRYGLPVSLLQHMQTVTPITVIDVGAHRGNFVEVVSKYSNIGRAILAEPIPDLANFLGNKFKDKGYSVVNCALSDKSGQVEFEINEETATSSILSIKRNMSELAEVPLGSPKKIMCKTRTLDDVVNEANLDRVDLLKIDVQGAEHLVLKGGAETLKKTAMIWIEVSFKPLYENSSTFFEIYTMLNNSGFIFKSLEPVFHAPNGELLQSDALFVKRGE